MNTENSFTRLLILLLLTLLICLSLYGLPDKVFGFNMKRVDLLSDIRIKDETISLDSLMIQLMQFDNFLTDSLLVRDSLVQTAVVDSAELAIRESLYQKMHSIEGSDSEGALIEDYSLGRTGLKRFFKALSERDKLNRPVRIAVLGDSFIEGDIFVADCREALQKEFGGSGVGFVPVNSVAAKFRPTVEQKADGWVTHSLMKDKKQKYTLPGMIFEPKKDAAKLVLKTADRYTKIKEAPYFKFIYNHNENAVMRLSYNGADTITVPLPPTTTATEYVLNDTVREAIIEFIQAEGFRALGIALEDNSGIVVDNYSLRGNSGLLMKHLDMEDCHAFHKVRPYDLIILQYGLNVLNENTMEYGWYRKGMVEVVEHMQNCFPDSDMLLLGISDRARQKDGAFETMPSVLSLLHAQRQVSQQTGVPFWNTFGAMGGENSMVKYVNNNWASKDYTHLSFKGGKEIAKAFVEALLAEKKFYDEAEKPVN